MGYQLVLDAPAFVDSPTDTVHIMIEDDGAGDPAQVTLDDGVGGNFPDGNTAGIGTTLRYSPPLGYMLDQISIGSSNDAEMTSANTVVNCYRRATAYTFQVLGTLKVGQTVELRWTAVNTAGAGEPPFGFDPSAITASDNLSDMTGTVTPDKAIDAVSMLAHLATAGTHTLTFTNGAGMTDLDPQDVVVAALKHGTATPRMAQLASTGIPPMFPGVL